MNVGFIGLGIMGRPMAANLLHNGISLLVHDLQQEAVDALTAQGAVQAPPAEIGQQCDLVFTILPRGDIVQDVLFGADGVAKGLHPGSLVVDMSSVTPIESRLCYDKLSAMGIGFLDAPVSGGEPGAIAGTLSFMIGGEQSNFDRAYPYLMHMGASAVLVGSSGSGSVTKLANQIIVNLGIAAVSEALVLAVKAGVDPQKVYEAIRGGLAGSAVLDAKAPMMYHRNFKPGGRISINHKDIKNVVATAEQLDIPLPLTNQLYSIMQALMDRGLAGCDHSAIVQYFEMRANVTVKSNLPESD